MDPLVVESVVLPEGFFRYVTLSRESAYGKELAACAHGGVWVGVRARLDQSQFLYAFVLFAQCSHWTLTLVNSARQIGLTVRLRCGTKCQLISIVHWPYSR